ncbi:MAG: hypothetical protein H6Q48_3828 [Deltaproteobacteria bacterium]|nr:hypothetical protein [Deltaproteobacteria bacterium]
MKGDLTETLVRSAVMKEMDALNRCAKKTGNENLSLKGEWIFTLLVDRDGRVKEVRALKGPATPEGLSRCIQEILKTIRFQADSGRQDVPLKLTFSFG